MAGLTFKPGVRSALDIVTTIVMLLAAGTLLWVAMGAQRRPPQGDRNAEIPIPKDPLLLERTWTKGNAAARVGVVEFSEFECPFCQQFSAKVFPTIEREYIDRGHVLWAYRHFPLDSIHPLAVGAAAAADCAERQNRFWDMHHALFSEPRQLAADQLLEKASKIGLDLTAFQKCVSGIALDVVQRDRELGRSLGVRGTPSFFIGVLDDANRMRVTKTLRGIGDVGRFKEALDDALNAVAASRQR